LTTDLIRFFEKNPGLSAEGNPKTKRKAIPVKTQRKFNLPFPVEVIKKLKGNKSKKARNNFKRTIKSLTNNLKNEQELQVF